jgi:hypothetical protein
MRIGRLGGGVRHKRIKAQMAATLPLVIPLLGVTKI